MKFVWGLATVCLVALLGPFATARMYSRCEVARRMYSDGFPKSSLPDWVCLVESESSFNSSAKGGPNTDGSYDWGLFQINDRYWCTPGSRGKECGANCYDFVNNDDISEDLTCIKQIHQVHGFEGWYGWVNKCKGRMLKGVEDCFQDRQSAGYAYPKSEF